MTDAESFEEGYLDRLAGNVNRDKIESEPAKPGAAAYRAGVRTCQADLMARNSAADDLTDHTGHLRASDYVIPAWERRLAEFWAKLRPTPRAEQLLETMAEAKKQVAAGMGVPEHLTQVNHFAEPEPSAKKSRKAKPADEGQGSLFG